MEFTFSLLTKFHLHDEGSGAIQLGENGHQSERLLHVSKNLMGCLPPLKQDLWRGEVRQFY